MSEDSNQNAPTGADDDHRRALLGPPPVLSSEVAEHYEEVLAKLRAWCKPRDFMEELLAKDLADATWEARRYLRHKTLAIER